LQCIKRSGHLKVQWTQSVAILHNDGFGAGFSDVGVTGVRLAGADVREAPRHEIA